jgi:hemerythrin
VVKYKEGAVKMVTLSKDMEVGVLEIDAQHKELVDRLNALMSMGHDAASKEETQKTIDLLEEYIVKHFADEEELQRKNKYPEYESHKKMHELYIGEFQKLKKEFADNGHSLKFTMDLNNSLINWIVKHIKSADVELGKFLRG